MVKPRQLAGENVGSSPTLPSLDKKSKKWLKAMLRILDRRIHKTKQFEKIHRILPKPLFLRVSKVPWRTLDDLRKAVRIELKSRGRK